MRKYAVVAVSVISLFAGRPDQERVLVEAVLLHPIRPSVSKHLFERLDEDARVRYGMRTGEWDLAVRSAAKASRETVQELLELLYAEQPRMGADLFGSVLADMPAAITNHDDLFFVARNMLVVAKIDDEIAAQAAERIMGSLEPLAKKDPVLIGAAELVLKKRKDTPALPAREVHAHPQQDYSDIEDKLQAELDAAFPLQNYRGQVVMVTFWAPWCAPCRREMPRLLKTGVPMIQVTDTSDPDGRLHKQFEVSTLPVTLVFDRNGRAVARLNDEQTDEFLARAIERARK